MTDSFANTTTIKNALAHIISPKIVRSGGIFDTYETKFDLVNVDTGNINTIVVDNVIFQATSSPQTGIYKVTSSNSGNVIVIPNSKISKDSIVFAEIQWCPVDSNIVSVQRIQVNQQGGSFDIYLSRNLDISDVGLQISWFVSRF